MLGLALDSAGGMASAALWRDRAGSEDSSANQAFDMLAYRELPPESGKADQLILVVEQLLQSRSLSYGDLDVIAVNRGPGSFTGIRSAVALCRGLALATQRPVIGVTTHEALALSLVGDDVIGLSRPRPLMIAEDARRSQVYVQSFDVDLQPLGDVRACSPEIAAEELGFGPWDLGGSGAALVREHLDDHSVVTIVDEIGLDARAVALAASTRLIAGEKPMPGFDLLPLYIRAPDAVRPKPLVGELI
ncbi:MAG: tRNA (adenosine(37)-N6)-threonylcarbamoyltransferase complex dimerization subunit type 1 TsaB [Geminicoccales bacterium]